MMAEAEVIALEEALCKQTLIVKELKAELEEERKAAASGVNEALSMIMRLQEEKAVAMMEACHYKRMAEEKIQHAEESMLILKEVIFQKEMEIHSLKYQVDNYTQKLSSIRVNIEFEQVKMDYYPSLSRGNFARILSRNISLPAVRLEELYSETDIFDKFRSFLCDGLPYWKNRDFAEQLSEYEATKRQRLLKPPRSQMAHANRRTIQLLQSSKSIENKYPSNDQSDMLSRIDNEKLAGDPECSWHLEFSGNSLENLSQARYAWKRLKFGSFNHSVLRTRSDGDALHSMDIQDIFEVQDSQNGHDLRETPNKMFQELSDIRHRNEEALDYLKHYNQSIQSTSTIYGKETTRQPEDAYKTHHLTPQKPKNRIRPNATDIGQIKERIHWLEKYLNNIDQEDLERDVEQLKLLRDIINQLDTRSLHPKKPKIDRRQEDDTMFSYLVEAMLSFSI